jgi:hypothetical protein
LLIHFDFVFVFVFFTLLIDSEFFGSIVPNVGERSILGDADPEEVASAYFVDCLIVATYCGLEV